MRNWRSHLADFSGVAVASAVATAGDGLLFWVLSWAGVTAGLAAFFGALLGGVIHYSSCRLVVFRRFELPVAYSAPRYVAMSGSAALIHAGLVMVLSSVVTAGMAWFVSKALVYVGWTYPLSRYVVFSSRSSGQA